MRIHVDFTQIRLQFDLHCLLGYMTDLMYERCSGDVGDSLITLSDRSIPYCTCAIDGCHKLIISLPKLEPLHYAIDKVFRFVLQL